MNKKMKLHVQNKESFSILHVQFHYALRQRGYVFSVVHCKTTAQNDHFSSYIQNKSESRRSSTSAAPDIAIVFAKALCCFDHGHIKRTRKLKTH